MTDKSGTGRKPYEAPWVESLWPTGFLKGAMKPVRKRRNRRAARQRRNERMRQAAEKARRQAPTRDRYGQALCMVCGRPWAWPSTGMCGPCTTGEADSLFEDPI